MDGIYNQTYIIPTLGNTYRCGKENPNEKPSLNNLDLLGMAKALKGCIKMTRTDELAILMERRMEKQRREERERLFGERHKEWENQNKGEKKRIRIDSALSEVNRLLNAGMKINCRKLAKEMGVSHSTITRYINKYHREEGRR